MTQLFPQPKPGILNISPYVGGDITPPGMTRRIVLASNENPLGPSPKVIEAIQQHMKSIHCYPSGNATHLKEVLSAKYGLPQKNILTTGGSEEILQLVARAFAGLGDEVIFNEYGFIAYKIMTLAVGATPVLIPQPTLNINVDNILSAVTDKTKIIYLDTPANPLGCYLSKAEVIRLHQSLPSSVILVLDEAYAEFMVDVADYGDCLDLAQHHQNIVISRTFSKLHALANLRVGWGYCPDGIADVLNRIRQPFNVNGFAQTAAINALQDDEWACKVFHHVRYWNRWLTQELSQLGYNVLPSQTNFILVQFDKEGPRSASAVYQYLGQNGIIVRPVDVYGLSNYLRISIGLESEMKELINLMKKI
jgi:histidinol-phosphate aminotransferase